MDNQNISRRKLSKLKDCFVSVENEALHQNKSSSSSSGKNFGRSHDQYYSLDMPNNYSFYSLVESMPVTEPIWSTTEPSVLASNSFSCNSNKEFNDFEFLFDELVVDEDQNQASSWWFGFLNSLDGKNVTSNCDECFYKYPKEYGCELRQEDTISGCDCESCDKSVLGTTDEWLSFPSTPEDQIETTMFLVP